MSDAKKPESADSKEADGKDSERLIVQRGAVQITGNGNPLIHAATENIVWRLESEKQLSGRVQLVGIGSTRNDAVSDLDRRYADLNALLSGQKVG